MTPHEATEIVELLAREFRIRRPKVTFGRTRRAWASKREWRIHLSKDPSEFTVLHEFAHILSFKVYGKCVDHDERFCHQLWKVICVWYRNPMHYDWHREYERVKKYGLDRIDRAIRNVVIVSREITLD